MIDEKTKEDIEWIENKLSQIQEDVKRLKTWSERYLDWIASRGYARNTCKGYGQHLMRFVAFVEKKRVPWEDIFTLKNIERFRNCEPTVDLSSITGLAGFLFEEGEISSRLTIKRIARRLPTLYEDYLSYQVGSLEVSRQYSNNTRSVLKSFHEYLQRNLIKSESLNIEHIDEFLSDICKNRALTTGRFYRSIVRGFLRYLYHHLQLIGKDLAPFVSGPICYTRAKPPKFLRTEEVKKLFESFSLSTAGDIRTYAMVHLAYTLGLRPREIGGLTLDDVSFTKERITLKDRKNGNPLQLPLPQETLKALAAYVVGARPESGHRQLFLGLSTPHDPIGADTVCDCIKNIIVKVNPSATAYWLRHTYAQNLLESGATIFEVKEMLGHSKMESTKNYLHVHTRLMREVLFDETI